MRVERPHVARRIVLVHKAIAYTVAEDDEILVDHRRRRVRIVLFVDLPDQPRAEIDDAVAAERVDDAASSRIETDQAVAAVDEDPERVACRMVAPRCHAAVHEATAVGRLTVLVCFGIERPALRAGIGVQRDDAIVRRAEVQHVVDHQRRRLKFARTGAERRERLLARGPLPRDRETRDGGGVDVGQRRVLRAAGVAAVERPILFGGAVRLRRLNAAVADGRDGGDGHDRGDCTCGEPRRKNRFQHESSVRIIICRASLSWRNSCE